MLVVAFALADGAGAFVADFFAGDFFAGAFFAADFFCAAAFSDLAMMVSLVAAGPTSGSEGETAYFRRILFLEAAMTSGSAFPDARWGRQHAPVQRAVTAFASSRAGSWTIRKLAPLDARVLARSKGRYTVLGPIGAPAILLTTVGRKSGLPRSSPLLCVHDGDRLIVVGSNFGQQHHPAWTANLIANPEATVTMAGQDIDVTAAPITGADKDRLYQEFIEVTGSYAKYLERTDRAIRMFALTRR